MSTGKQLALLLPPPHFPAGAAFAQSTGAEGVPADEDPPPTHQAQQAEGIDDTPQKRSGNRYRPRGAIVVTGRRRRTVPAPSQVVSVLDSASIARTAKATSPAR